MQRCLRDQSVDGRDPKEPGDQDLQADHKEVPMVRGALLETKLGRLAEE